MSSRLPPPPTYNKAEKTAARYPPSNSIPMGAAGMSSFGFAMPTTALRASQPSQPKVPTETPARPSLESVNTIENSKADAQHPLPKADKKKKWYHLK